MLLALSFSSRRPNLYQNDLVVYLYINMSLQMSQRIVSVFVSSYETEIVPVINREFNSRVVDCVPEKINHTLLAHEPVAGRHSLSF